MEKRKKKRILFIKLVDILFDKKQLFLIRQYLTAPLRVRKDLFFYHVMKTCNLRSHV